MMMRIETGRLRIRTFQESDAAGLYAYLSSPRVNCFLDEKLDTLEEAIANVEQRKKDELQLAVCLKEDDKIIGNLFAQKEEPDTYSVGWQFNGKYEGKGYAREAANAYLTFLFNDKNARRIYAYVEETNLRSQKLCERLGMRKEGCFKEFISFTRNEDGTLKYENTLQYAVCLFQPKSIPLVQSKSIPFKLNKKVVLIRSGYPDLMSTGARIF